jgi:hypothetical protein
LFPTGRTPDHAPSVRRGGPRNGHPYSRPTAHRAIGARRTGAVGLPRATLRQLPPPAAAPPPAVASRLHAGSVWPGSAPGSRYYRKPTTGYRDPFPRERVSHAERSTDDVVWPRTLRPRMVPAAFMPTSGSAVKAGADGDREALPILLRSHRELTTAKTRTINRLRALLLTGSDADRALHRGGQHQTPEHAVRRAEVRRLGLAISGIDRDLADNKCHLAKLVTIVACDGHGPSVHQVLALGHRWVPEPGLRRLAHAPPLPEKTAIVDDSDLRSFGHPLFGRRFVAHDPDAAGAAPYKARCRQ